MNPFYELFDLASGSMVEDYNCEQDAMETLMRVVEEHGSPAIAIFALSRVEGGQRQLIAKQDDLILRVEQQTRRLVPQSHKS